MTRLLLLILLLTVVYSWEECKFVLSVIWSKITGRNQHYTKNIETDVLVADIVLIATIPLTLAYAILSNSSLPAKLFVLLLGFLFISFLIKGIAEFSYRRRFVRNYQGFDRVIGMVFSLSGLFSPGIGFASDIVRTGVRPGRYLLALVFPLATGIGLALAARHGGMDGLSSQTDLLIKIAVLGLILNVTIDFLEKIFRSHHMRLDSLARIGLGIAIIFILTIN